LPNLNGISYIQPAFSFEDTGLLNNDGITNNGVITINNLEVNATWQYSISGDNGFVDGTGLQRKMLVELV
jgi:hypothetical protein